MLADRHGARYIRSRRLLSFNHLQSSSATVGSEPLVERGLLGRDCVAAAPLEAVETITTKEKSEDENRDRTSDQQIGGEVMSLRAGCASRCRLTYEFLNIDPPAQETVLRLSLLSV